MDTLPYELFADVLKYVKQSEILNIIESSKLPRMFRYLLQIYTIHDYNHKSNEKQCIVKISTNMHDGSSHFIKSKKYLEFNKLYLPSFLRCLKISVYIGWGEFKTIKPITSLKKLKTFINHSDHYYDITMLNVKELLSTSLEYPIKLEKLCITNSCIKDSDINNLPNTLKYLDLRKTNSNKILILPPQLETLLLHFLYSHELPQLPIAMKTIAISSAFNKNWDEIYNSNITRLIYTVVDASVYSYLDNEMFENHRLTDDRILINKFTKIKHFHVIHIDIKIFSLRSFPPNIVELIAEHYEINYTIPLTVKKLHCLTYNSKIENNITSLIYECQSGPWDFDNFQYYSREIEQKYPYLTSLDIKQNDIVANFPLHLVKLTIRNYSYPANIGDLTKLKVLKIGGDQPKLDLPFFPQYLIYFRLYWTYELSITIDQGDLPHLKKWETNCHTKNLHFLKSLKYLICPKSCHIPKHVKYVTLIELQS